MKFFAVLAIAAALSSCAPACAASSEKAPSSSTPEAAPATPFATVLQLTAEAQTLEVDLEGHKAVLTYGAAWWRQGDLVVTLHEDSAISCGSTITSSELQVNFDVPWGHGNAPSTSRDVEVGVQAGGRDFISQPRWGVVKLSPFVPKKGARIRGHLEFESRTQYSYADKPRELLHRGKGSFEAEICNDVDGAVAAPEDDSIEQPLHGTWSGKPLTLFDGLATVEERDGVVRLIYVEFPMGKNFDCAAQMERRAYLGLSDIGGAKRSRPLLLDGPQPVDVTRQQVDDSFSALFLQAGHREWLTLDRISFEPGGEITGTLFAASPPGEEAFRVMGKFRARVCPRL